MHATNATITALNSAKVENAARIDFASPAVGGRVVVVSDIILKKCKITYNSKDGFAFGYNNPQEQKLRVVADATPLDFGAETYITGGANLVMTNGAVLCRKRSTEGDNNDSIYNLRIEQAGLLTLVSAGELRAGVTYVNGDLVKGAVYVTPEKTGAVGIEVLAGGVGCWYKAHGMNKGTIRFSDGIMDCFKGYWWGWGNRAHIFNFMAGVDIPEGKTMTFRGTEDKMDTNDQRNILYMMLEAPFTGGGDVFVTNTWEGKTLSPILTSSTSTCTGRIEVLEGEPNCASLLYFQDGANWAGTVIANGRVALARNFIKAEVVHDIPVAVTFGALDLQADFPVRVWRGEDGTLTNDTLNVGTYLNNGGKIVPTMMTEDGKFTHGDKLTLGRIAKGAALPRFARGWAVRAEAIDDNAAEDLLTCCFDTGMMIIIR
jgi:hypothetical protein